MYYVENGGTGYTYKHTHTHTTGSRYQTLAIRKQRKVKLFFNVLRRIGDIILKYIFFMYSAIL